MTQEEMGRALDAANRKLAAVTIAARLAGTLDSDYAQIEGEKHAGAVRFNERGDLNETSLAAIVKEVLSHAPAKFRRDDKSNSPQFYDDLRAAVAARNVAADTGGTAELRRRVGG